MALALLDADQMTALGDCKHALLMQQLAKTRRIGRSSMSTVVFGYFRPALLPKCAEKSDDYTYVGGMRRATRWRISSSSLASRKLPLL